MIWIDYNSRTRTYSKNYQWNPNCHELSIFWQSTLWFHCNWTKKAQRIQLRFTNTPGENNSNRQNKLTLETKFFYNNSSVYSAQSQIKVSLSTSLRHREPKILSRKPKKSCKILLKYNETKYHFWTSNTNT